MFNKLDKKFMILGEWNDGDGALIGFEASSPSLWPNIFTFNTLELDGSKYLINITQSVYFYDTGNTTPQQSLVPYVEVWSYYEAMLKLKGLLGAIDSPGVNGPDDLNDLITHHGFEKMPSEWYIHCNQEAEGYELDDMLAYKEGTLGNAGSVDSDLEESCDLGEECFVCGGLVKDGDAVWFSFTPSLKRFYVTDSLSDHKINIGNGNIDIEEVTDIKAVKAALISISMNYMDTINQEEGPIGYYVDLEWLDDDENTCKSD